MNDNRSSENVTIFDFLKNRSIIVNRHIHTVTVISIKTRLELQFRIKTMPTSTLPQLVFNLILDIIKVNL